MLEPLGRSHGIDPRRRADITIFYGEPQQGLSTLVRSGLRREGFADIRTFTTVPALARAIDDGAPDLVLIDGEMPGGDVCDLVRDVREGKIGRNPFVATIVMAWQPTLSLVQGVLDSGSDDMLVKPNSPEQFLTRMTALAHRRKPFVVTSDYIGPDRRAGEDPNLPRIRVPNTLRDKAVGQAAEGPELTAAIAGALTQVNEQRLKRHAVQVARIAGAILPAYAARAADEETRALTQRLLTVAEDMVRRLAGTRFEHVGEICGALLAVAQAVVRAHPAPGARELALLPRLAEAMMVGFNPSDAAARAAGEISSSVDRYLGERAPAA